MARLTERNARLEHNWLALQDEVSRLTAQNAAQADDIRTLHDDLARVIEGGADEVARLTTERDSRDIIVRNQISTINRMTQMLANAGSARTADTALLRECQRVVDVFATRFGDTDLSSRLAARLKEDA